MACHFFEQPKVLPHRPTATSLGAAQPHDEECAPKPPAEERVPPELPAEEPASAHGMAPEQSAVKQLETSGMDQFLRELVSFKGRGDLLRGSRLSSVMRSRAAIFASKAGSAATYALLEPVDVIGAFLSHNWDVGRYWKYMCLCMKFNFPIAFIAALAFMAITWILTWLEVAPVLFLRDGHGGYLCFGSFFVTPVFLLGMFFGHDLRRRLCLRDPSVFLDKTCIHQADKALQQEGIRKLGAFLRNSSHMVTIYTNLYLTKLWTVYELACFVVLHPTADLTVIPTIWPAVVLCLVVVLYLVNGVSMVIYGIYGLMPAWLPIFVAMPILAVIGRLWARMQARLYWRLEKFQVEDCTCFCEEDRPLVYHNIAVLMRADGKVGRDASEAEALGAFNGIVRERLPGAFAASIGPLGMRYSEALAAALFGQLAFHVEAEFAFDGDWRNLACTLPSIFFIWNLSIVPLWMALWFIWCRQCLHLRGLCEILFLSIGIVWSLLLFMIVLAALNVMRDYCLEEDNAALAISLCVTVFLPLLPIRLLGF